MSTFVVVNPEDQPLRLWRNQWCANQNYLITQCVIHQFLTHYSQTASRIAVLGLTTKNVQCQQPKQLPLTLVFKLDPLVAGGIGERKISLL